MMHAPGNNIRPKQITLHDPEMLEILLNNYILSAHANKQLI